MLKYPILNLNLGSDKYGYPLHIGIKNHDFGLVRKLLAPNKYIVNINVKDSDGNNALHYVMGHFGYDP
jgi:ankyrin repeat protein